MNVIELNDLRKYYPVGRAQLRAVDGASLSIASGEVVAVVGESGSGKSTLGRLALRLIEPTSGSIRFEGTDISTLNSRALRRQRRRMQMIFQDPFSSLNPHMRISDMLAEVLVTHGIGTATDRRRRIEALLDRVGLRPQQADRFPHEFSGGQRQRIAIARALAVDPSFIVADEAVSALDVSVQAQVINLLQDIRRDMGLAMMFISHDLAVVRHIADRVAVMYLGRIVELGPCDRVFDSPQHPYTDALLSSVPRSGREPKILQGDPPSPISPPSGCGFRMRCPRALPECAQVQPAPRPVATGWSTTCIRKDILPEASS